MLWLFVTIVHLQFSLVILFIYYVFFCMLFHTHFRFFKFFVAILRYAICFCSCILRGNVFAFFAAGIYLFLFYCLTDNVRLGTKYVS